MSSFILAEASDDSIVVHKPRTTLVSRVLGDWFAHSELLNKSWQSYQKHSASRRVSYRMWQRHGAWLEIQADSRNG